MNLENGNGIFRIQMATSKECSSPAEFEKKKMVVGAKSKRISLQMECCSNIVAHSVPKASLTALISKTRKFLFENRSGMFQNTTTDTTNTSPSENPC